MPPTSTTDARVYQFLPRPTRRHLGAVHPDRRTRHRADHRWWSPTRAGASSPAQKRLLYTQTGNARDRAYGRGGAVRPLPHRRVRGVGTPRHRRRSTCSSSTSRSKPSTVGTCCVSTHPRAATVRRSNTTATSTRAITTWSRSSPAGQHPHHAHARRSMASPAQRAFGDAKRETLTAQCQAIARCATSATAAAPKTALRSRSDGEPGQNYLCPGLERFFMHTGPVFHADGRNCCSKATRTLRIDGDDRRARTCTTRPLPVPCGLWQRQEVPLLPRRRGAGITLQQGGPRRASARRNSALDEGERNFGTGLLLAVPEFVSALTGKRAWQRRNQIS